MPIYITEKDMDPEALASSLARTPRAAAAILARIRELNPQFADVTRIPKGGVLILPDSPDIKAGTGASPNGDNLAELAKRFRDGLRDVARRATERGDAQVTDHAAVRNALKSATAKRLVEGDEQLRKRLAAAEANFKAEQKRAAEIRAEMRKNAELAEAEFTRLQKLWG